MDIAVSPSQMIQPGRRIFASCDAVRLGMPHLSLGGLSETWLLKELGHRHWSLLARMSGRDVPDFHDGKGDPVYAAFCAVSIRDAGFASLAEHDELIISSEIARISRTQFASIHRLTHRGISAGTVELSSVFVKRHHPGRNRSIARVSLDGFPPFEPSPMLARSAKMAAMIRGGHWTEHFGFRNETDIAAPGLVINPCPSQDFNGAEFLYFASFQAFTDRAEWEFFGSELPHLSTVARDIVYHGNIEVGDRLVVSLFAQQRECQSINHWFQISSEGDGSRIADVFTRRILLAGRADPARRSLENWTS